MKRNKKHFGGNSWIVIPPKLDAGGAVSMTKKREGGLAKCEDCGDTLIAPYDGNPYWCIACSQKQDRKREER